MNITELVPAGAPVYVIASYGSLIGTTFANVSGLPTGYKLQTGYAGGTQIAIVQTGAVMPYTTWATTTYSLSGVDALPGSDPDKDGVSNKIEFALNSNPTCGASQGLLFAKMATVASIPNVLTLTIATRDGAAFSPAGNNQKSAVVDRITYTVTASNYFSEWGGPVVTKVTGGDATTIQDGLTTPDTGWSYKTFRTNGSAPSDSTDFIRVGVE